MIPKHIVESSERVLFVTHLAIGDFTYLQNCFSALKKAYPHLKLDLWNDEVRRTRFFWEWKRLAKYSLIDWVRNADLFDTIYADTYAWSKFHANMDKAKQVDYPLVVSLCVIRPHIYAQYARKISDGFVAAIVDEKHKDRREFAAVDYTVQVDLKKTQHAMHVSSMYRSWFQTLFNIQIPDAQLEPFVAIPDTWLADARARFASWGIDASTDKVVFVNSFAKNVSRCWPFDRTIKLISQLQQKEAYKNAYFILNVEPAFYENAKIFLGNFSLPHVRLFTADESFFQLPAIISLCNLVVSVETSVIHLASALKIPVLALMRKKNPEWSPFYKDMSKVICAERKSDWIEDIPMERVLHELLMF